MIDIIGHCVCAHEKDYLIVAIAADTELAWLFTIIDYLFCEVSYGSVVSWLDIYGLFHDDIIPSLRFRYFSTWLSHMKQIMVRTFEAIHN